MKICLVHNSYGRRSGEEVAVDGLRECLQRRGHDVISFTRSSSELDDGPSKVSAFFSGIYSVSARREFGKLLAAERPDLVHINNLYPLISPSILDETQRQDTPVVMTLHNYRLLCPTGLLMSRGEICHRCIGGQEWWCALRNCTGERPKSAGYAVRSWVARSREMFIAKVDRFIAPAQFVKQIHSQYGYPANRIDVVPYIVSLDFRNSPLAQGQYVGYVGRISPEKGIETILEAATRRPEIPFHLAGHYQQMPDLPMRAPENCLFLGEVPRENVGDFIDGASFTVFPSKWYETTGLSMVETMARGKTVICSRIGCLPELINDGVTGILFEPGDADDLSRKIQFLWDRPDLCRAMGAAARESIQQKFYTVRNYELLSQVYEAAIASRSKARVEVPRAASA